MDVNEAILCAREAVDRLEKKITTPPLFPIPVWEPVNNGRSNLVVTVSEITNRHTKLYRLSALHAVCAYIKLYEGDVPKAEIGFSSHINYCQGRFFVCKELAHALLSDTRDNRIVAPGESNVTDTSEKARELIATLLSNAPMTKTGSTSKQYHAEYAAYFAAVEMLLPTKHIEKYRTLRTELKNNRDLAISANATLYTAMELRVPEGLIEFRLDPGSDVIFSAVS